MKRLIVLAILLVPSAADGLRAVARTPDTPTVLTNAGEDGDNRRISSDRMATPERAEADARAKLARAVRAWLAETANIPRARPATEEIVASMIRGIETEEVARPYGPMFVRSITADFSPAVRERFVRDYEHEVAGRRLAILASVLTFVLFCLGTFAGYIRADEATRGYYTNSLRLAATAGVGAAGVMLYRVLA